MKTLELSNSVSAAAVCSTWILAKCEGPAVGKQTIFYKQSLFYLETSLMVV